MTMELLPQPSSGLAVSFLLGGLAVLAFMLLFLLIGGFDS